MNFTYDCCIGDRRLRTTTTTAELTDNDVDITSNKFISVTDNLNDTVRLLRTPDDLLGWITGGERAAAWKPGDQPVVQKAVSAAVDPSHYKGYIEEMQWIDAMSRIPSMRDPKCFKAAVELQIRKYLDRSGQKDTTIQEMMKARWYLSYLCAYIANGDKPILVADVERLIASIK